METEKVIPGALCSALFLFLLGCVMAVCTVQYIF